MIDNSKVSRTPAGDFIVPRDYFDWTEEDRVSYAVKNGWFEGSENYAANRLFSLKLTPMAETSTEYKMLNQRFQFFREERRRLDSMMINIPKSTHQRLSENKQHSRNIKLMLQFIVSIIYRGSCDSDEKESLRAECVDAWALFQYIPILYLGAFDGVNKHFLGSHRTSASHRAARQADKAANIAGLGSDWVDLIIQNLEVFRQKHAELVQMADKTAAKEDFKSAPGFHSVSSASTSGTTSTTTTGEDPTTPMSDEDSDSSQELLEQQRLILDENLTEHLSKKAREKVRKLASSTDAKASDQMKALLNTVQIERSPETFELLKPLVALEPVNEIDTESRRIVKMHADSIREKLFVSTEEAYGSIANAKLYTSGDICGWKNDHFAALVKNSTDPVLPWMTLLFEAIARADPIFGPDPDDRLFNTSTLIPIPKCKGKKALESHQIRPVAVPNALHKRGENWLVQRIRPEAVKFLNPRHETETGDFVRRAQYSFGIRSGCSITALRIKSIIEANPDWCTIQLDFSNAFNSVDMEHIFRVLREIAESTPGSVEYGLRDILPYLESVYSHDQFLKMHLNSMSWKGEHIDCNEIRICRGVLQGAPLSPLVFNLALSSATRILDGKDDAGNFIYAELLASLFADDMVLQGCPSTILNALDALLVPLSQAGLSIKFVKVLPHSAKARESFLEAISDSRFSECTPALRTKAGENVHKDSVEAELYRNRSLQDLFRITVSDQIDGPDEYCLPAIDTQDISKQVCAGLKIVGIPVGNDAFIRKKADEYVEEAKETFDAIVNFVERGPSDTTALATKFNHASHGLLLFKLCGVTKFDFLYHNFPTRTLDRAKFRIQKLIDGSFARIVGISTSFDAHKKDNICTLPLLRMPSTLGGLHIPDVNLIAPVAFYSTMAACNASVMSSLPSDMVKSLDRSPLPEVSECISEVRQIVTTSGFPEQAQENLLAPMSATHTALNSETIYTWRHRFTTKFYEHVQLKLKTDVEAKSSLGGESLYTSINFLKTFKSQLNNGLSWCSTQFLRSREARKIDDDELLQYKCMQALVLPFPELLEKLKMEPKALCPNKHCFHGGGTTQHLLSLHCAYGHDWLYGACNKANVVGEKANSDTYIHNQAAEYIGSEIKKLSNMTFINEFGSHEHTPIKLNSKFSAFQKKDDSKAPGVEWLHADGYFTSGNHSSYLEISRCSEEDMVKRLDEKEARLKPIAQSQGSQYSIVVLSKPHAGIEERGLSVFDAIAENHVKLRYVRDVTSEEVDGRYNDENLFKTVRARMKTMVSSICCTLQARLGVSTLRALRNNACMEKPVSAKAIARVKRGTKSWELSEKQGTTNTTMRQEHKAAAVVYIRRHQARILNLPNKKGCSVRVYGMHTPNEQKGISRDQMIELLKSRGVNANGLQRENGTVLESHCRSNKDTKFWFELQSSKCCLINQRSMNRIRTGDIVAVPFTIKEECSKEPILYLGEVTEIFADGSLDIHFFCDRVTTNFDRNEILNEIYTTEGLTVGGCLSTCGAEIRNKYFSFRQKGSDAEYCKVLVSAYDETTKCHTLKPYCSIDDSNVSELRVAQEAIEYVLNLNDADIRLCDPEDMIKANFKPPEATPKRKYTSKTTTTIINRKTTKTTPTEHINNDNNNNNNDDNNNNNNNNENENIFTTTSPSTPKSKKSKLSHDLNPTTPSTTTNLPQYLRPEIITPVKTERQDSDHDDHSRNTTPPTKHMHDHDVSRQLLNYDFDNDLINSNLHEADLHLLSDFISNDKTLTREYDEFSDPPDDNKSETKITNSTDDIPSHKSSSSNRSLSTRKTTGSIIKKSINSDDIVANNKEKKFSP